MAIEFIEKAEKNQNVQGSNFVVDITGIKSTGILNDDVMICFDAVDGAGEDTPGDGSWVEIFNVRDAEIDAGHRFHCWYRIVTDAGSEPDTYTFSGSSEQRAGGIVLLRGVDLDNVVDVAYSATTYEDTDDPTALSVDTETDNALVFRALGIDRDDGSPVEPAGLNDVWNVVHSGSGRAGCVLGYEFQTPPGATGTAQWTSVSTAAESIAVTLAIRSADAGGVARRIFIVS